MSNKGGRVSPDYLADIAPEYAQFTQELTAQMQSTDCQSLEFTQEAPAQIQDVEKTVSAIYRMGIMEIEKIFLNSPVARINWASQMVILDGSLPLGIGYWYMKQSVEMGWSSNVLKIQIETNLYSRQISNNKVNNFTSTLEQKHDLYQSDIQLQSIIFLQI